ncbi:MAG: hypothetical protein AB9846_13905 [Tenuifilaceae bacterium]
MRRSQCAGIPIPGHLRDSARRGKQEEVFKAGAGGRDCMCAHVPLLYLSKTKARVSKVQAQGNQNETNLENALDGLSFSK